MQNLSKWIYFTLTVIIFASCLLNFFLAPYFECVLLYEECDHVIIDNRVECSFAWSLCITCSVTLAVLWIKYRSAKTAYDRLMESHDAYSPTTAAERKNLATFTAFIFVTCATVMLPVNVHRLFTLYTNGRIMDLIVYFVLMYAHNAIICMMEMHFVVLCYALYRKLVTVNRDIQHIDDDIADGCPPYLQATMAGPHKIWIACRSLNDCRDYCYYSRTTGYSLADGVERLKIRHRLVREALEHLNRAFAIPLGLALCNLCIMTLFDIFYHVTNDFASFKMNVYLCLWITQYTFRFSIIVMVVHVTTKQARKSKEIVMNINRHYLDLNTKEELQLFSNQISSTTVEFTICGLFTLNTHLFTSVMGACITYFLILFQMNINTENIY